VIPSARLSNAPGDSDLSRRDGRLLGFFFSVSIKNVFLLYSPPFFSSEFFFFSLHSFLPKFIYLFFLEWAYKN